MYHALRYIVRTLYRFTILWVVDAISLVVASTILTGITITGGFSAAAAAALMLSMVNLLIRPLILLLALPLGFFVTFVAGLLVNGFVLLIASNLLPDFQVEGLLTAIAGGLVFASVNTVITGVLTITDDDSFYQGIVERLARRQTFRGAADPGVGLVMLEIDGLSYQHIQTAVNEGYMPTVREMIEEDGYVLSRIDCGLPSQTSACQAGIMFGDNYDIPSFRWYDKSLQKLFVSSRDASAINERYARGHGLMRGGSSINNMLNGDAEKSVLTLSNLTTETREERRRRAEDIYLLALNPYFLMRTIVLFLSDALREVWEYQQDRRRKISPLLNRMRRYYPFVRAATTVLMRDIAAYLITLDIARGAPSLYMTWPGYDEVAHHSGPSSRHALRTLRSYDGVIEHVRRHIDRAPRPYDLILLSDHGQSFGSTFLQRYGYTLREFIERQLPAGTTVSHTSGGDDGMIAVAAMAGELDNIQQQGVGGNIGNAVVKQARKASSRSIEIQIPEEPIGPTQVTVCGSGNIAQVYFDLHPRKITMNELSAAYPGMVDAVVQHEGVGFVVAYDDDGTPVALSKNGTRNLHTGAVSGDDPFQPYGDTDLRAWQVRRIADFPHSGDLIVNSTLYPDGTVAAMEELIGSHGGLGGRQTDAFMLHPGDMKVPPTKCSTDVFSILNARRGMAPAEKQEKAAAETVDDWAFSTLNRGIRQLDRWLPLAFRALFLDRKAYKAVTSDPYMTGPALLIGLSGSVLAAVITARSGDVPVIGLLLQRVAVWLVTILVMLDAGRILRGRANFSMMFRGVGFAHTAFVLDLLTLIPRVAPLARLIALLWAFFTVWIAASEAHALRGWRSLVLPVVFLLTFVVSIALLRSLFVGAAFTLYSLEQSLGLVPW